MSATRADLTPSLVARLRDGSNEAGELLDNLYGKPLVRFAWGYLGERQDAEDAVQDVFCKVLTAREVPDDFRAWIYRVARNHCLNLLRHRKRRRADRRLGSVDLAASLAGNLTRLAADEARETIARALESLPEGEREVLRLRYTEGLSREEIAAVLEIPLSTVKSRLFESLRKVRRETTPPDDSVA